MISSMTRSFSRCLSSALPGRVAGAALSAAAFLANGGSALAADEKMADGRLQNYGTPVVVQGGGTATSWMLLVGLGVLCLIVLFKNARRSHLD